MRLSPTEKDRLKELIDTDELLPTEYRSRLFAEPPGVELTWPGKRADDPESNAGTPVLRAVERYGQGDRWRDRLILGDNTAALRALRDGPLRDEIEAAGGLRLIYLDPPFLTGRGFASEVPVGETLPGTPSNTIGLPAYRDGIAGGLAAYLTDMFVRLRLMHDLLADDGSLYFHCDHRVSAAMRLVLDEVFGPDRLVNEIVWHYGLGNPGGRRAFARKHDTILLYAKTDRYRFNRLRGEITPAMAAKYRHEDENGRYLLSYGKKYYLRGGKPFDSVWTIPTLGATDGERVGYPTQKPEALLERIIQASSVPGDLVADFCCGAGTLPAVAARLGRRWLACDAAPRAIQTARSRLLGVGVTGFDLMEIDGAAWPALPLDYVATVSAAVEVRAGTCVVRLTGYAPLAGSGDAGRGGLSVVDGHLLRTRRTPEGAVTEPITRRWPDWIESWAVAIEPDCGEQSSCVFSPIWWAARVSRRRTLDLVSPPLPLPRSGAVQVTVKVVDVLGRETVGHAVHADSLDP